MHMVRKILKCWELHNIHIAIYDRKTIKDTEDYGHGHNLDANNACVLCVCKSSTLI